MGWHETHPDWSKLVHETAADLARAAGYDPAAPNTPEFDCGELGMFTNADFFLPEAVDLIGPPDRHGFGRRLS